MKKIGMIGAGLSSLYSACYLAKKGHQVIVYDKNNMPGGRSQFFESDGFTFDMGPSWYWMPDVIDRMFDELGEKRTDYFKITRLNPAYQVFWNDRTSTNIPSNHEELISLFDAFEKDGGKKLQSFLDDAKVKYDIAMSSFVENPGIKLNELLKFSILKDALKLDVFKSVEKDVENRFNSLKARDILNFPVLFLGERPSKIPAMYTLMNYADLQLGTWYPEGGMNSIAQALEKIAKDNGATFQYGTTVDEIQAKNGAVSGLKVNGKIEEFDRVIAGADYNHVEQQLLPKQYRRYDENYWDKRKMAPSSLIFYIGVNNRIAKLEHHNLFFDERLEDHGKEIYDDPKWPTKPLFYVSATSKTDQNVAPEGCENLMILIPLATELDDTDEMREKYFNIIMERMEMHCDQDIRKHVIYNNSFCINDFKTEYNSYKGNAYGLANTLRQTANLKPKIKSKLENLYFCGQLTVPGPGIPPALISGKIAAKQLITEL
ncbi:MAG: phytoene desaturase family protein [Crocinitomicaceae bacterium]|nr:phytoene desaturase family protein [Crocinitomicaceae bacterium]